MIRSLSLSPGDWQPDPVLAAAAEALGELHPEDAQGPDRVLPLDPLGARAGALLRQSVLEGPGGLPPVERELTGLAVARLLGCAHTASLHAARFIAASGTPRDAEQVLALGSGAVLPPRWQAIISFAEKIAATPPTARVADLLTLRGTGLTDPEIMDLLNVAALVSASARLALALGRSG